MMHTKKGTRWNAPLITAIALLAWAGCATVNTAAFRTLSVSSATAERAASSFKAYVQWARQTQTVPETELVTIEGKVARAYDSFAILRDAAFDAHTAYTRNMNAGATQFEAAVSAASAAGAGLVGIINELLPPERRVKAK